MALCVQPNAIVRLQQRQALDACQRTREPTHPSPTAVRGQTLQVTTVINSFRNCVDAKLSRRGLLLSTLFAVGAHSHHGHTLANQAGKTHLPIERIKDIIENDIRQRQYYITGDLTQKIYEDNCRFVDPTTDIRGVDKYVAAIKLLFDPNLSHHELKSIDLLDSNTIQVRWKLEGYLKFPWHPHIQPYEGTTVYRVNDEGLIVSHEETWEISLWTALLEFLTPTWNKS